MRRSRGWRGTISPMSSSACCAAGRGRWSHEHARGTAAPRDAARAERAGRAGWGGELYALERALDAADVVLLDPAGDHTGSRATERRHDDRQRQPHRRRRLSRRHHDADRNRLSRAHSACQRRRQSRGTQHPHDLPLSGVGVLMAMKATFTWDGLTELKQAMRNLPNHLAIEAATIVNTA